MRFVIIGGGGQDGRWASKILRNLGHEVILVIRPGTEYPHFIKDLTYKVDLVNPVETFQFLEQIMPDRILHLAAVHGSSTDMVNNNQEFKRLMRDCHVGILENLISWQRKFPSCKITVTLSSHIFNGYPEDKIISEDTEPFPTDYYGESKLEAWNLITESRNNLGSLVDAVVLFNHTSLYSKPNFLFPKLAIQIQKLQNGDLADLEIKNIDARISICHAYDVVQSIIMSSLDNTVGDFIIGNEKVISIRELLTEFFELSSWGNEFLDLVSKKIPTKTKSRVLIPNSKKAGEHLLWEPTISPVEILAQMACDYSPSNLA